ncbi:hypothetical protein AB0M92_35190 [Streptomyces sp. NPDC051582]|uniref:hypothetical protein n=1 Tax=Streptomyces sp. NPDC051582 TaxID=3155167 RepID=UPI003444C3D1
MAKHAPPWPWAPAPPRRTPPWERSPSPCWANLRYSANDSHGALHLLDGAFADHRKISSPRMMAMLHARAARAHSKAGTPADACRQIAAAFAA